MFAEEKKSDICCGRLQYSLQVTLGYTSDAQVILEISWLLNLNLTIKRFVEYIWKDFGIEKLTYHNIKLMPSEVNIHQTSHLSTKSYYHL